MIVVLRESVWNSPEDEPVEGLGTARIGPSIMRRRWGGGTTSVVNDREKISTLKFAMSVGNQSPKNCPVSESGSRVSVLDNV